MAKSAQTNLRERDLDTYVADRIKTLDLSVTLEELQADADNFQNHQNAVFYQRQLLAWPGAMLVVVAIGGVVFSSIHSILIFLIAVTLLGIGAAMLSFGINPRRWEHRWTVFGPTPILLNHQSYIQLILAPIVDGKDKLAKIAPDGHDAELTPHSHQPIAEYIGARAFEDPRTAAMLFGSAASCDKFVVISPAATGDWFNFYMWNNPVAGRIEDLFEKATGIYPREPIKRTKAKIAVSVIARFVTEHKLQCKQFRSKDFVVRDFEKALKLEAVNLRSANQIDDLGERQLCALSISGEPISIDPFDIDNRKMPKPHSWFLNLMSGDYNAILGPLADTVLIEFGELPTYVDS
jgi:F0F1-type ATP synthase assembly protein I